MPPYLPITLPSLRPQWSERSALLGAWDQGRQGGTSPSCAPQQGSPSATRLLPYLRPRISCPTLDLTRRGTYHSAKLCSSGLPAGTRAPHYCAWIGALSLLAPSIDTLQKVLAASLPWTTNLLSPTDKLRRLEEACTRAPFFFMNPRFPEGTPLYTLKGGLHLPNPLT